MIRKRIAILGSTGSIGRQALEVISTHPEAFKVEVLTANSNIDLLIKQAEEYKPNAVVIGDESLYSPLKEALKALPIKVYAGSESLRDIVTHVDIDMVLLAMVGFSGLNPAITAIESKKSIAIANKEILVVAGDLITRSAKNHGVALLPVDSEHSAIFQSLVGELQNPIEKIYLTASGGPFHNTPIEQLKWVTKKEALQHPNWVMGEKISIDSATMMNKGLEVIEAKWLFDLTSDQIDILIHPQSIVHSMVQFQDGSIKAQMGTPDMKLPIQYAFSYPYRMQNRFPRFDFAQYPALNFSAPDTNKFPSIALAYKALRNEGNSPCVLNAANEVAVDAFLKEKISFFTIPMIIEECLQKIPFNSGDSLLSLIESDRETRRFANQIIQKSKINQSV